MNELLIQINWLDIVIAGVITTFIVSALVTTFDVYFNQGKHKKYLVVVVATLVTLVRTSFNGDWQDALQSFLFTWAFSVLFYSYLGGFIINLIFERLKDKLRGKNGEL